MALQEDLVARFQWVDGHANVWPWFADAELFARIVDALAEPFAASGITSVVGIESRAFLLAGAVARELKAGVVPVRKRGAIFPGPHHLRTTAPDWRGREIELLLQRQSLRNTDRILIVDDWLQTGSQILAAVALVEGSGAEVRGVSVIVDESPPMVASRIPGLHALIEAEMLGAPS